MRNCKWKIILEFSQTWQRHSALSLVFAAAIFIRGFAHFIRFKKYDLGYAFIRINFGWQRRGVGKLERHITFPFRFEGSDVNQDSASRVGAFAETHGEYVSGDAKIFNRPGEGKTVWRNQLSHRRNSSRQIVSDQRWCC